ncbi:MAG: hypothetical protein B7Z05_07375 [Thiotrichales bacterium 32-46-8]|jgi:type II secretion system protein C|nr:MAG: hypothetical protein B7Z05_07375 [Thiotrichales bacterium 32-46-8]OYY25149.1 MAG: hypothetical protein B7Y68_01415 [Thiotrichales bacterium 35-46-9]OZA17169.1 MAG: hypothetical protein B7X85_05455 [Thiotrichales bacterium 17-46-47]OZA95942.1 MAG: hypothetical protein B7X52_06225 [Thiotrichales bacterium 34-46-19]OZB86260.1 MAG: hypothetical protein B7Z48_05240 [Thiotrichales bacterium 12-47-6]HQT05388.1 hypothetical protein [Thiotrichales bacterium]
MNTTLLNRSFIASSARTFSKLNRPRLRWLVAAVLLVTLSWQTARWVWLVLTPTNLTSLPTVTSVAHIPERSVSWQQLFPSTTTSAITTQSEAFADASVLNGWQLLGVLIDDAIKLALVQQGSGGGLVWLQENQLTPQGVKVERIEATQVQLLTKQGSKWLKLASSQQQPTASAVVSVSPSASSAVNLSELRQQAKQNPTTAMQWLNLQPQFEQGRLVSVLVQPKSGQEAIFKQLGFMVGDQLLALNGQPMSEWMAKLASLPSVLDGAGASVKVLRAGKEQEWSVTW